MLNLYCSPYSYHSNSALLKQKILIVTSFIIFINFVRCLVLLFSIASCKAIALKTVAIAIVVSLKAIAQKVKENMIYNCLKSNQEKKQRTTLKQKNQE